MSISDRAQRSAPRDYELDTSFIQRPHHTDPRRLYSQTSTDWQHAQIKGRMMLEGPTR
jgi:hypothetical protein